MFGWFWKKKTSPAQDLRTEGGWTTLAGMDVSGGRSAWQNANSIWKRWSTTDLEKAYAVASMIYACVRAKCVHAGEAWMEVGEWTKKGWKSLDDHILYDLMRRPNGGQDRMAFLWEIVAHAELTGFSYVWKLRNRGGGIIALQPVPTSWVTPQYDRSGMLIYYSLRKSLRDQETRIIPQDMMVMKYPSASDPASADGPLGACIRDLQIDNARADLLIEMLDNIHFPGAIIKTASPMLPQDKEEARSELKDVIGSGKRMSPLFLSGENADITLPSPPSDMDWGGTAAQAETRVCAAFGVPPIMLHFRSGLDRGTYSNYETARKSFYVDTMKSLWMMLASMFERGVIIDEGEEKLEVEPNYENISEMQEDEDARHARIRDDFHGGLMLWDEAIEAVGGTPLPGGTGRVYMLPMNLQMVSPTGEVGGSLIEEEGNDEDEHLEDADVVVEEEEEDGESEETEESV